MTLGDVAGAYVIGWMVTYIIGDLAGWSGGDLAAWFGITFLFWWLLLPLGLVLWWLGGRVK